MISANGIGKRTSLTEYPKKGRATGGILTTDAKALNIIGRIVGARVVQKKDELTIISESGKLIRTRVEYIKRAGRATRGVRLMNLGDGESVATLARIATADLLRAGISQENGKNAAK